MDGKITRNYDINFAIQAFRTLYLQIKVFVLYAFCIMHSGDATNSNFVVFGLFRTALEHTIYHTRGEQLHNYTIDVVYTLYSCCVGTFAYIDTEFDQKKK